MQAIYFLDISTSETYICNGNTNFPSWATELIRACDFPKV